MMNRLSTVGGPRNTTRRLTPYMASQLARKTARGTPFTARNRSFMTRFARPSLLSQIRRAMPKKMMHRPTITEAKTAGRTNKVKASHKNKTRRVKSAAAARHENSMNENKKTRRRRSPVKKNPIEFITDDKAKVEIPGNKTFGEALFTDPEFYGMMVNLYNTGYKKLVKEGRSGGHVIVGK